MFGVGGLWKIICGWKRHTVYKEAYIFYVDACIYVKYTFTWKYLLRRSKQYVLRIFSNVKNAVAWKIDDR